MNDMNQPLLKDDMNSMGASAPPDGGGMGASAPPVGGMGAGGNYGSAVPDDIDMNAPMDDDLDPSLFHEAVEGEQAPPQGWNVGAVAPSAPPDGSLDYIEAAPADFKEYNLTEDEARGVLVAYADDQCCWGTGAASKTVISQIQPSTKYLYVLDTFTEERTTSWTKRPFRCHDAVDGPENGPPPEIWSIGVQQPALFSPSSTELAVPHTDSVSECSRCRGGGRVRCQYCHGRGREKCHNCHGSGRVQDHSAGHGGGHGGKQGGHGGHGGHGSRMKNCHLCHGRGRRRCNHCHGHGRITCNICDGEGSLLWYQLLTVFWRNHQTDEVVYRQSGGGIDGAEGLPDRMIAGAASDKVLSVQGQRVAPLSMGMDKGLQVASKNAIDAHAQAWPLQVKLAQRQYVGIVPIFEIHCDEKVGNRYWVYGLDRQVYCPDYSQTCCWVCSVM